MVWKLFLWSSFRKSYSTCWENSDMAKFGPFKAIFGQNWQFLEFLTYNFQTQLWIFLIFGMEVVLMVLFQNIIIYMLGKLLYGKIWSFKTKIWLFCQNWQFWEFFTYNFQTLLRIFLIFGMKVVLMVFLEKIIFLGN